MIAGDTPEWWIAHENRLVKYDENLDEYEEIAQVPDDDTITDIPPGNYGEYLMTEATTLTIPRKSFLGVQNGQQTRFYYRAQQVGGLEITQNRIYTMEVRIRTGGNYDCYLDVYDREGNPIGAESYILGGSTRIRGFAVYSDNLYTLDSETPRIIINPINDRTNQTIINLPASSGRYDAITVTPDRIITIDGRNARFFDHDGNHMSGEGFAVTHRDGVAATQDRIFILNESDEMIYAFTYAGTELTSLNIPTDTDDIKDLSIFSGRIFTIGTANIVQTVANPASVNSTTITLFPFSISGALNYHGFSIYQFDTTDFENFYVLTTNTLKGDVRQDTTFNRVRVQKYVKSTDTWSTLLDSDDGEPQLAHPVDLIEEIAEYADNRKNDLQVVRRSNKTLIFYRRVQASTAGIAYKNETDDTLTDIYSETFGTNDGLPYSMDFVLDERSDGIYVYTFVVKYTLSGSTFTSATLKVYRERVEPSASQTEIFSETFTGTSGTDEYPISVSDIILADDRSKFYFVLEYFSESSSEAGKSELCELAKDGSGSRTVLKTYDNPLVGPRSPVEKGGDYYYLEGGWARRISDDDDQPDKYLYPNEGGRLIEIESNGDITDHGIVWRSRTKRDSPNPDPEAPQYDGWGLHNAVVSNMVADSRDNLRFIAGYGLPYRINNNLPTADITGAIPDESNFVWVQYGQDLATKIASFPTNARRGWELIQQLGQLMKLGNRVRSCDGESGRTPSRAPKASATGSQTPASSLDREPSCRRS